MTDENKGDAELIAAVRGGDTSAFDLLYRRHVEAAKRMARGLSRDAADVDDLVAESFARLLSILSSGGGPDEAFRAYLLTTMRHLFYEGATRARKVQVTDDLSMHEPGVPFVDTALQKLELSLVSRAFAKLPERWQTVLWHTEVERERPATVAPLLGISPNGVAALAYRAREALRQLYLQEHIENDPDEDCRLAIERLGAYVRSGLSARDQARTEAHLEQCARCHLLFVELSEVNSGLRGVLAPALLAGSASSYFAAGAQTVAVPGITWWTSIRRIARRRSTQAAAASAVLTALVALAVVLTSQSGPIEPPDQAADPPRQQPAPPAVSLPPVAPSAEPTPQPSPPTRSSPPGAVESSNLEVTLVPVAALVRGRPGTLAMTVIHRGTTPATAPRAATNPAAPIAATNPAAPRDGTNLATQGDGGASATQGAGTIPAVARRGDTAHAAPQGPETQTVNVAFGPWALAAFPPKRAKETGPLTALITVPAGVILRAGPAGDGWQCTETPAGMTCVRSSLPPGETTHAFVSVDVSGTASDGTLRVQLTAPHAAATSSAVLGKVQTAGMAASFAGVMPATVTTGGNTLMNCSLLALGCLTARHGRSLLGGIDNGDYYMSGYADPAAPNGAPSRARVSGATIPVRGKVLWAGLYWSGSGSPPADSKAHFWVPGKGVYQAVNAQRIDRVSGTGFAQPAFQASADVTSLVRGTAGGSLWVAVDENAFTAGFGAYGGWALVLVVQDDGPLRTVTVLDGFLPVHGSPSLSTPIYGTAGVAAKIAFVGWEGDRGLTGDRLKLGSQSIGGSTRENIAASRTDGTTAEWNTFGVDARLLDGLTPPAPGGITATSDEDAWILGTVAIAILTEP